MRTNSRQGDIVRGRVLNEIQIIKRGLSKGDDFFTYNDLLIIGQIVPKLPEAALVQLLQGLRILHDTLNSMPQPPSVSISPLLAILAGVREEVGDHLLNDFLGSAWQQHIPSIVPTGG